jgi:hypothetical protein
MHTATALLVFKVVIFVAVKAETKSQIWYRLPGNSVSLSNPSHVISYVTTAAQCAWKCKGARGVSRSFCYDVSASACHVDGILTSLQEPVTPANHLRCFGKTVCNNLHVCNTRIFF